MDCRNNHAHTLRPDPLFELNHPASFEQVKDKNLLVFGGTYDSVSPINEMILPLWHQLETHKTTALQKRVEYPTEHGLLGRRICVIKEIAEFIHKVLTSEL